MSEAQEPRKLFLLGQQLSRLSEIVEDDQRQLHVCGRAPGTTLKNREERQEEKSDPWKPLPRFPDESREKSLHDLLVGPNRSQRVALVCDAGLVKTTNMQYLEAQLTQHGCRQVPLLVRLDDPLGFRLLKEERTTGHAFVDRLAQLIDDATHGDRIRDRHAMKRLQVLGGRHGSGTLRRV
jgi:hypothetical protein